MSQRPISSRPVAVVTGAGVRVGQAIAVALGSAGFDLVLHSHRSSLDKTEALLRPTQAQVWCCTADLSKPSGVRKLATAVKRHTRQGLVLVNSAATYAELPFAQITAAALEHTLALNLLAPFSLAQALRPELRSGCLINITDACLRRAYTPEHRISHYVASKGALSALTQALAVELAPHTRVNAVAPGAVAIPASTSRAERNRLLKSIPLRREGTPQDVADAVVYLAQAEYVTGQTLVVDGGMSVG